MSAGGISCMGINEATLLIANGLQIEAIDFLSGEYASGSFIGRSLRNHQDTKRNSQKLHRASVPAVGSGAQRGDSPFAKGKFELFLCQYSISIESSQSIAC
jgi:hypothetical protein